VADEQFGRWARTERSPVQPTVTGLQALSGRLTSTLRAILMAEASIVIRTCIEESRGVR
jgi:hypothetical protein